VGRCDEVAYRVTQKGAMSPPSKDGYSAASAAGGAVGGTTEI